MNELTAGSHLGLSANKDRVGRKPRSLLVRGRFFRALQVASSPLRASAGILLRNVRRPPVARLALAASTRHSHGRPTSRTAPLFTGGNCHAEKLGSQVSHGRAAVLFFADRCGPIRTIPIRLQAVPFAARGSGHDSEVELDDPLDEEQDSPVPGVTHRYPDRALVITTPVCSMYCRFCTRKRVTMDRDGWDAPSHDEVRMIEYIRETTDYSRRNSFRRRSADASGREAALVCRRSWPRSITSTSSASARACR